LAALGMSMFNLVVVLDATQAFLKWLPRSVSDVSSSKQA